MPFPSCFPRLADGTGIPSAEVYGAVKSAGMDQKKDLEKETSERSKEGLIKEMRRGSLTIELLSGI